MSTATQPEEGRPLKRGGAEWPRLSTGGSAIAREHLAQSSRPVDMKVYQEHNIRTLEESAAAWLTMYPESKENDKLLDLWLIWRKRRKELEEEKALPVKPSKD